MERFLESRDVDPVAFERFVQNEADEENECDEDQDDEDDPEDED
jgi:hypothetical protein